MATEAAENRILDVLVAAFDAIGPVGAIWNTEPSVTREVPGDAIPGEPNAQIFIAHVRTDRIEGAQSSGLALHTYAATFGVYYVGIDATGGRAIANRRALNVAKDARRALYAAEKTLETTLGDEFNQMTVAELRRRPSQANDAGTFMYGQAVEVQFEESHPIT